MSLPRLVLLLGSGGVGKTTVGAALALRAAEAGHKVLLLTIDPAQRLSTALRCPPLTGPPRLLEGYPTLSVAALDRRAVSDALVRRYAPDSKSAQEILSDPLYQAFSGRLAGVQEYMASVEIEQQLQSGTYELLIVDTPPAQHALDLFDAPRRLRRALRNPALSWLQRGGARRGLRLASKALARVTAVEFIDEVARFLQLFARVLEGLERDGSSLADRLRAEDARSLLIATPERAPLAAALQTAEALRARSLRVDGLILNRSERLIMPWSQERADSLRTLLEERLPHYESARLLEHWRATSEAAGARRHALEALLGELPPAVQLPSTQACSRSARCGQVNVENGNSGLIIIGQ